MEIAYNVEPALVDIVIRQRDTFQMSFDILLNDLDYSFGSAEVKMRVIKQDGTLVRELMSIGESPAITLDGKNITFNSTGFDEPGEFPYDVQVTKNEATLTFMAGTVRVHRDVTP